MKTNVGEAQGDSRASTGAVNQFAHSIVPPNGGDGKNNALRLARGAEHLHRCGPRTLTEFLLEIGERRGIMPDLLDRLDAWRRLDPIMVAAVLDAWCGGRQFAPALFVVGGAHA